MKTLAIDTSSNYCSVAVFNNTKCASESRKVIRTHNIHILNMVEQLLKNINIDKNDLELLAYGVGPGSFVGVRISSAVIQAIALVIRKPVLGFSSMALAAMHHVKEKGKTRISVLLDAKMGDAYLGNYIYDPIEKKFGFADEKCIKICSIMNNLKEFAPETIVGDKLNIGMSYDIEEIVLNCKYSLPLIKHASNETTTSNSAMPVYLQGNTKWRKLSPEVKNY
jgi:tRNA threonylcarbamoyladenosine biosynthesis protein TsaB